MPRSIALLRGIDLGGKNHTVCQPSDCPRGPSRSGPSAKIRHLLRRPVETAVWDHQVTDLAEYHRTTIDLQGAARAISTPHPFRCPACCRR